MEKDISFLKGKIVAHRGMHNIYKKIPENSISAFSEAIKNGYAIEFDVHILKDDMLVVFHDDNLKRVCGIDIDIKDKTYDEIKDIKLFNTEEHIPTFEEVLNVIDGKVPIVIEVKHDVKSNKIIDLIMEKLKDYKGKYVIKSFDPFKILYLKKNYPEVIRGQLSASFKKDKMPKIEKILLKNLFFNFLTKPDFISYEVGALPNKHVEKFRKTKPVFVWTIRNKSQYEKAKEYGDTFIAEGINRLEENGIVEKGGTVLVNLETKKIGLVYRVKREDYSFPKGHLEEGETILECAVRETEEETGRKCEIIDEEPADILTYSTPLGENVENYMFIAIDRGVSTMDVKDSDKEKLVWVDYKRVEKTLTYEDLREFWRKVEKKVEKLIKEESK